LAYSEIVATMINPGGVCGSASRMTQNGAQMLIR
jgi:hypothetical protein